MVDFQVGQKIAYYDGGGAWGDNEGEITEVQETFVIIRWYKGSRSENFSQLEQVGKQDLFRWIEAGAFEFLS
jgi:hypothetical protein